MEFSELMMMCDCLNQPPSCHTPMNYFVFLYKLYFVTPTGLHKKRATGYRASECDKYFRSDTFQARRTFNDDYYKFTESSGDRVLRNQLAFWQSRELAGTRTLTPLFTHTCQWLFVSSCTSSPFFHQFTAQHRSSSSSSSIFNSQKYLLCWYSI